MSKSEKEVFLNMMSLVSDYPKYIMLEKFLEGKTLNIKNFTDSDLHLPCRAVYQNLRRWRSVGILTIHPNTSPNKVYQYTLDVEKLIEKLS